MRLILIKLAGIKAFVEATRTGFSAVMGAEGAAEILYKKELAEATDPVERRKELIQEYNDELANPYVAAERGYIDQVIYPHSTRETIIRVMRLLRTKRETLPPKKHGNIPL